MDSFRRDGPTPPGDTVSFLLAVSGARRPRSDISIVGMRLQNCCARIEAHRSMPLFAIGVSRQSLT